MSQPDRSAATAPKQPLLRDLCSRIHSKLDAASKSLVSIDDSVARTLNPTPTQVGTGNSNLPIAEPSTLEGDLSSILRRLEAFCTAIEDTANTLQSAV